MAWRVAESLQTLLGQLNALYPNRSKVSDGSIGDERHQKAGTSDHLPNANHVVTARDFTHDPGNGINGQWLANALVASRDPRIKYVIWNKQICSSKQSPWVWRPYSGANAHQHHVHVSVDADPKLYDSTAPWNLSATHSEPTAQTNAVTPATPQPSADPLPIFHTVVSGDTLSGLAGRYHTGYADIMKLNGLTSTVIKVGEKLRVK